MKKRIALTMGDPSGIGPELTVKAASCAELAQIADIVIYGSKNILLKAGEKFAKGKNLNIIETSDLKYSDIKIGKICSQSGEAALKTVVRATKDVINKKCDAIVTTPMNKASVNKAGFSFTGHTELIAELCNTEEFVMQQSSDNLRIAFVTTHIPLKKVVQVITQEKIIKTVRLLEASIKREGINNPKIAICAINPHGGENGFMGTEDELIVKPAIAQLAKDGFSIQGPFPPDTVFIEKIRTKFDGIVSMYHDQGHIPFKMLAFDTGVNSTLGLPIIRTSVDHGTAFDIAWKGIADTGSLFAAIKLACSKI